VAATFPDVAADHLYVDAAAMELVRRPGRFDREVIVSLPDRAATVREIQHALQARNRRRAVVRWVTTGAVAAAAAAVALFIGWHNFGDERFASVASPAQGARPSGAEPFTKGSSSAPGQPLPPRKPVCTSIDTSSMLSGFWSTSGSGASAAIISPHTGRAEPAPESFAGRLSS